MSMTYCQAKTLPSLLTQQSAAINAPTGSGKTLIYITTLLTTLLSLPELHRKPAAIVLVPNKELTNQVFLQFSKMLKYIKNIKPYNLLNTDASIQEFSALKSKIDILITTPATLVKSLRKVDFDLSNCKTLVIDEADLMVEYGHKQYLSTVQKLLPAEVQLLLFSATITEQTVGKFAWMLGTRTLEYIDCMDEELTASNKNIDEFKVLLDENDKLLLTVSMFKLNVLPMKVLIFVNSVEKAYFLKLSLECFGINSQLVIDEQSIETRESLLAQFNAGNIDALITYDYVKDNSRVKNEIDNDEFLNPGILRGLDFSNVGTVLNYEFPRSYVDYMHRIGRTGRGNKKGMALSYVKFDGLFNEKNVDNKLKYTEYYSLKNLEQFKNAELNLLDFDIAELYSLRYRINDVTNSINKHYIRKMREAEQQKSVLNTESVQQHFEQNPSDLEFKRKLETLDFKLCKVFPQFKYMGNLPDYIMPGGGGLKSATLMSLEEGDKLKRKRYVEHRNWKKNPKKFKGRWWLKNRPN